jgi:hypothetical protein
LLSSWALKELFNAHEEIPDNTRVITSVIIWFAFFKL